MKETRFHLLDILRGIAALSLVFFHWKHFYFTGVVDTSINDTDFPFYSIFSLFYNYGLFAVYLFFILSGFIFFFLYSEKIKNKTVSLWNFFVLRISRLYPLHFITLLAVLVLQQILYVKNGMFSIYVENNLYHFILHLFFISSWGLEQGNSFNYPAWSVSVEILLYLIFFIICVKIATKSSTLIFMVITGLTLTTIYSPVGIGIFFFFLGGIIHTLYLKVLKLNKFEDLFLNISILNLIKMVFMLLMLAFLTVYFAVNQNYFLIFGILFGIIIFCLILIETKIKENKYISYFGDFFSNISYSSYLLHFPLQLIFIFFMGMNSSFFYTKFSFVLFFGILIILSILSHKYFEIPVQKILRNKLLK